MGKHERHARKTEQEVDIIEKPKKGFRWTVQTSLLATVVLAFCLGCSTAKTQVKLIQPEYDASTYRRLITLGMKVAQAMEAPSVGVRYGLLDTEDMNAMVDSKNKTIYVTKGLMSQLNDKEFLCVLAHEWAHVTKGHYGKRLQTAEVIDGLSALVSFVNPVGMIASALTNPVAKKSFTRAQEEEADAEAARVLNDRLRISPYACISAFRKLRSYGERTGRREGGAGSTAIPQLRQGSRNLRNCGLTRPRFTT